MERRGGKRKGGGGEKLGGVTSHPLCPPSFEEGGVEGESEPQPLSALSPDPIPSFSSSVPSSFFSFPGKKYCVISVGGGYTEVGRAEAGETKIFLAELKKLKKEK